MRVELPRRLLVPVLVLTIAALTALRSARAETPPPMTVIVFADHTMQESGWAALLDALDRDLTVANGVEGALVEVLRGDRVTPGIELNKVVTVYLHGNCRLMPGPKVVVEGALGWVKMKHGRIEPFVHVECTQIEQMLAPLALAMNPKRRDAAMGDAIARVVEHEWLHIATQSDAHREHGVMQAQFTVYDLLRDEEWRRGFGRGR